MVYYYRILSIILYAIQQDLSFIHFVYDSLHLLVLNSIQHPLALLHFNVEGLPENLSGLCTKQALCESWPPSKTNQLDKVLLHFGQRKTQFGYISSNHIIWEKPMAPHSSTLTWKIPWTEEPGGLPSMGSHRVGQDWSDVAAAACNLYGQ